MMKQFLNIIMALLVVFSSMGVAVGKHYCQGELQSISVFAETESCHKTKQPACHQHKNNSNSSKKGCCDNEIEYYEGIDLETSVNFNVNYIPQFDFTPALIFIQVNLRPTHIKEKLRFYNFHPPPIAKDILVFVQSFLL